jgi:hypothetical protein
MIRAISSRYYGEQAGNNLVISKIWILSISIREAWKDFGQASMFTAPAIKLRYLGFRTIRAQYL